MQILLRHPIVRERSHQRHLSTNTESLTRMVFGSWTVFTINKYKPTCTRYKVLHNETIYIVINILITIEIIQINQLQQKQLQIVSNNEKDVPQLFTSPIYALQWEARERKHKPWELFKRDARRNFFARKLVDPDEGVLTYSWI